MVGAILTPAIFAFLLIFCRVGSASMLLPGIGETFISPTIRLAFALLLSFVMVPMLTRTLPAPPDNALTLAQFIAAEVVAGSVLGMLCRLLLSALHTAGTIVSLQSGLSAAMLFDVTQASQGTLLGNLMTMSGLAFWFMLDFHHLTLTALFDSYGLFPPGHMMPPGDTVGMFGHWMGDCFLIALQITAPIMLVMLMLNLGGGLLSRLMPAMQVFYLLLPVQLLATFFLLQATADGMYLDYFEFVETRLTGLLSP